MLFVVLLKMLEASSNFHKYYPRQTKLLVFLLLKLALSAVSQAQALLQILPLLERLPRDIAHDPVSSSLEDTMLDQVMYAHIYSCMTKIRQFGNSQYVQLLHCIVVGLRQACLQKGDKPVSSSAPTPFSSPNFSRTYSNIISCILSASHLARFSRYCTP